MNLAKITETLKNPKARRYGLIALALAVIAVPVIRRKMAIAREKAPEAYPVALDLASPRLGVLRAQ